MRHSSLICNRCIEWLMSAIIMCKPEHEERVKNNRKHTRPGTVCKDVTNMEFARNGVFRVDAHMSCFFRMLSLYNKDSKRIWCCLVRSIEFCHDGKHSS